MVLTNPQLHRAVVSQLVPSVQGTAVPLETQMALPQTAKPTISRNAERADIA